MQFIPGTVSATIPEWHRGSSLTELRAIAQKHGITFRAKDNAEILKDKLLAFERTGRKRESKRPVPRSESKSPAPAKKKQEEKQPSPAETKTARESLLVVGPVSVTVWHSAAFHKHIVIFGERHEQPARCAPTGRATINVGEFIERAIPIVAKRDQLLDIFLEESFISPGQIRHGELRSKPGIVDLAALRERWKACLQPRKSSCHLPNVRLHYVDIRTQDGRPKKKKSSKTRPLEVLTLLVDEIGLYFAEGDVQILNEDIIGELWQEFEEVTSAALKVASKFKEQYDALRDAEMKEALDTYWNDHVTVPLAKLHDPEENPIFHQVIFQAATQAEHTYTFKEEREALEYVFGELNGIRIAVMEAYTLGRMFRCFRTKTAKSADAVFIVYYGGLLHAKNLDRFFARLPDHFKLAFQRKEEKATLKCLDMTGFSWEDAFPEDAPRTTPPCPLQSGTKRKSAA